MGKKTKGTKSKGVIENIENKTVESEQKAAENLMTEAVAEEIEATEAVAEEVYEAAAEYSADMADLEAVAEEAAFISDESAAEPVPAEAPVANTEETDVADYSAASVVDSIAESMNVSEPQVSEAASDKAESRAKAKSAVQPKKKTSATKSGSKGKASAKSAGKSGRYAKSGKSAGTEAGGLKKILPQIKQAFTKNTKKNENVKFSLRYKILLSFMVPIFFIIVVGVASYRKAESGMTEKYEASTLETVKMAAEHIDLASKYVRASAINLARDNEFNKLCRGSYDDDYYSWKKTNDLAVNALQSNLGANDFLKHLHLVTNSTAKVKMYSTKSNQTSGILETYWEEMKDPNNPNTIVNWIGRHESLDKALNYVDVDDYFFSYQALADTKSFIAVIDVSTAAVQDFIDNIELGEGSVLAIVSMNGRELIHETPVEGQVAKYKPGEINFYGRPFFKTAQMKANEILLQDTTDSAAGIMDVEFDGEKCLFFYAPCSVSGCMICALIPVSTVVAQAKSISTLTVALVVIALIVVLSIGLFITAAIQNNVRRVSLSLDEVAKGDLTVGVNVNGKDEFQGLAGAANDMVFNTKKLVSKVDAAAGGLQESANEVKRASDVLDACSEDITEAISDINKGMERQSRHADECVATTDHLSDEIKNVSQQVEKVKVILNETSEMISESVKIIKTLGDKAFETTKATDNVGQAVKALTDETKKINAFVGVIKKISSQTRLLSLNASIEAARAGESGRGFVVVADQIRNLANDSSNAAGEINKLVDGINVQAESSATSTVQAHDIVDEQAVLVNEAIDIFKSMQASIETLIAGMGNIDVATLAADTRRAEAVAAVRNIAGIISENANNAQTVMDVATQLKLNIDNLNRTARRLGESMDEMKSEVSVFKI